jgi:hypothetical protein
MCQYPTWRLSFAVGQRNTDRTRPARALSGSTACKYFVGTMLLCVATRIQDMGYWNDWTHGGTRCTQTRHPFRMSNPVIAKQRIGSMKKT